MNTTPTLTPDTADFLLWLVNQQTITVGAEDAEETAVRIFTARRELTALLLGPRADAAPIEG